MDLWTLFVAGLAAGLGVAMPLGAVGLLLIQEGVLRGWPRAVPAALGVACVDIAYCGLALGAGTLIAPVLLGWGPWPRWVAGLAVISLGVRQFITAKPPRGALAPTRAGGFVRFVVVTAANPLTLLYFLALTTTVTFQDGPAGQVAFVGGVGVASLAWQCGLTMGGATVGRALPARASSAFGAISSLIVIGLGGLLLFT